MAHDGRAIANLVLDIADSCQISIRPLKLQKIIYFEHGWWLALESKPLIRQAIEAWEFGPVVRVFYDAFKNTPPNTPISTRATYSDLMLGKDGAISASLNAEELSLFKKIFLHYAQIKEYDLVEMTHVAGGPWETIRREKVFSLHSIIGNQSIKGHFDMFKNHFEAFPNILPYH
jgi:uncharacterized phage-associated protein